jgi:5-methylcytosine-specific restriction endonuclease McrA
VKNTYGERCKDPAVDVDHIINNDDHSYFGPGDPRNNLQAICEWHHKGKTNSEARAAQLAAIRRTSKKFVRTETHPGLL